MTELSNASKFYYQANDWHLLPNELMIHRTALIGFQPMRHKTFAKQITGVYNMPKLADGVTIGPYAVLYMGCEIGEGTQICPYSHIREGVVVGKRCVIGVNVKLGYDVQVGDDCQLMDDVHVSGGTIIGNRCFISVHALMVNDDKPKGYQWKGVTPVIVEDDCVIGAGVKLRPGIRIGKGSLIGMGSVVTKDIGEWSVVKGPPAQIVA